MSVKIFIKDFFGGKIHLSRKFLFISLIIVSACILFNNLSENPLSTDGYYYANVSKSMVQNLDFITFVNADNAIDFTSGKGHLFYYLYALSGYLLGFSHFSMRLPSAILSFAALIILFVFLEKRRGANFAFITCSILLLTQQFIHHSRAVHPDGIFAVFFALAVMAFYIASTENKSGYFWLFGLFLAVCLGVRQAVGLFVLPTVFVYALSLPNRWRIIFNKHLILALLLAAALTLPWYLTAYFQYGDKFLLEYLSTPYKILTGAKFETSPFDDNGRITYLNILLGNYEPWFIFLVLGSFWAVKLIIKEKLAASYSFEKFILLWAYIPLILFLLMSGHKYYFLLPLYFPFAVLSAWGLLKLKVFGISKDAQSRLIAILFSCLALLAVLCFMLKLFPKTLDNQHYVHTIKIMPQMDEISAAGNKIYTIDRAKYYNAMIMFFRDEPNVLGIDVSEFEDLFNGGQKRYFVFYKSSFDAEVRGKYELQILGETKEDVLFSN